MSLLRSARFFASAANSKVSPRGSPDSLFLEMLDEVRRGRVDKDPEVHRRPSDVIARLTQAETEITRNLFNRLSENAGTPEEKRALQEHNIDPYWDPFEKVKETREKLLADYNEFSSLVTAAEAKRAKIQLRKVLLSNQPRYDPYTQQFRKFMNRDPHAAFPEPHRKLERFWQRDGLSEQLNNEKITWRDADILQHFTAPNGYILPRRMTMLSKPQHRQMVKSMKIARQMAIVPTKRTASDYQTMPLMNPLQWMADRLTKKVAEAALDPKERTRVQSGRGKSISPERAEAMLQVMMKEYAPNLNYNKYRDLKKTKNE